jgi:hypothetical protein
MYCNNGEQSQDPRFHHSITGLRLTDDEDKQVAALLKGDYALESLPGMDLKTQVGYVSAILQTRRWYLVNNAYHETRRRSLSAIRFCATKAPWR